MTITWRTYRLKLRETFSISYGSYDFRDSLTVMLLANGETGFGECVAINYYKIELDQFEISLDRIKKELENHEIVHPKEFFRFLLTLNLHPFLMSALDCAFWDLYGKLEIKSFTQLMNLDIGTLPESSFTICIDNIDQQLRKINQSSWQKFKVKCSGLDREAVYKLLNTNREVALDSNASLSEEDCDFLQNNERTAGFMYLEQPLPTGRFNGLDKNMHANWMCDEDCQNLSDLKVLAGHYSSVNIKVMKAGGITPALEMISEARKFGLKVMIGCMTESTVGISAGIALAGLCDYADLDGANLISNDFANGSEVVLGCLHLSDKPGLGISLR
ncbi:MAG: chloromuconate cycloisomerase [Weeksellaceae bacterium]|nr:chloromuconate cycloisomerase [Weeksellaceae bacterium]